MYLNLYHNYVILFQLWQILERSYPKEPPKVEPPQFNKEMVYENNCHVFEQVWNVFQRQIHVCLRVYYSFGYNGYKLLYLYIQFMQVDVDAKRIAAESQECRNYTTLIRHLVGRCTSDIEKARAIFRYNITLQVAKRHTRYEI